MNSFIECSQLLFTQAIFSSNEKSFPSLITINLRDLENKQCLYILETKIVLTMSLFHTYVSMPKIRTSFSGKLIAIKADCVSLRSCEM